MTRENTTHEHMDIHVYVNQLYVYNWYDITCGMYLKISLCSFQNVIHTNIVTIIDNNKTIKSHKAINLKA